jgi:hypothetical protein
MTPAWDTQTTRLLIPANSSRSPSASRARDGHDTCGYEGKHACTLRNASSPLVIDHERGRCVPSVSTR